MQLPVNYDNLKPHEKRPVREEYTRVQDGLCFYCLKPLTGLPGDKILRAKINEDLFPRGFFNNPVHLHHSHVTGMTLGSVHARCNAYLWQYLDE